MHIVCERSNAGNDVRCDICGQGFLVHWSRLPVKHRRETRTRVIQTLRRQHLGEPSDQQAHREVSFTITCILSDEAACQAPELAVSPS